MAKDTRSKEQMSSDVAFILNSPLHVATKMAVMKNVLWKWTEFDGKYQGCRYWTPAAVECFAEHQDKSLLRHEHVVPQKLLKSMLVGLKAATPEVVHDLLVRFAIGAVVTKAEAKRLDGQHKSDMPAEFSDPTSPEFKNPGCASRLSAWSFAKTAAARRRVTSSKASRRV